MLDRQLFSGNLINLVAVDPDRDPQTEMEWTYNMEYARLVRKNAPRPMSALELKKRQEDLLKAAEKGNAFHFAVRSTDDCRLIGFASLDNVVWSSGTAGMQLLFGELQDMPVFGRELLHMVLAYGFQELNLYRVSTYVPEYRRDLADLVEEAGFVREVHFRKILYRRNRYWDSFGYGLLAPEWKDLRVEVAA